MTTISGIPVTERHAKSKISILKTKSDMNLIEAAKFLVENEDLGCMLDDELAIPMSVGFMAVCWDISIEYARHLIFELIKAKNKH